MQAFEYVLQSSLSKVHNGWLYHWSLNRFHLTCHVFQSSSDFILHTTCFSPPPISSYMPRVSVLLRFHLTCHVFQSSSDFILHTTCFSPPPISSYMPRVSVLLRFHLTCHVFQSSSDFILHTTCFSPPPISYYMPRVSVLLRFQFKTSLQYSCTMPTSSYWRWYTYFV